MLISHDLAKFSNQISSVEEHSSYSLAESFRYSLYYACGFSPPAFPASSAHLNLLLLETRAISF